MTGDLTFGERLALAIKRFGPRPRGRQGADGSIRGFQIELSREERGLHGKGATRQMVHRYLKKDGPEPPADFIREAAKILSPVRYEWLATGKDEMTEAEQQVTSVEQGGPSNPKLTKYVGKQGWSASTQALFFEAWRRYVAGMPDGNVPDYELLHLGLQLVDLVNLPVRHWGFKHKLSDRETNDLAVAALHWLMLAMPEPGMGDSFNYWGVRYAKGFDLRYVDDRRERMQALADEYHEAVEKLEEYEAQREKALARLDVRAERLSKRLLKEDATKEEAEAAFDELRQELRQELGLTDETTEETEEDA